MLCAIACLFLFTSCFETTDDVSVVSNEPPKEGNIMECTQTIKFIDEINSYPIPRAGERRASIKKYSFRNGFVYWLRPSGEGHSDGFVMNSKCDTVCFWVLVGDTGCNDWNSGTVEYKETVWQDNR